jgi:hypothetical protein
MNVDTIEIRCLLLLLQLPILEHEILACLAGHFEFLENAGLLPRHGRRPRPSTSRIANMPDLALAQSIAQLSVGDEWGPETPSVTTLDGVPYAPFSKGDKLGRMADWTQEGKEGRDRGGRQYGRNFRGKLSRQRPRSALTRPRSTSLRCWYFLIVRCAGSRR